MQDSVKLTFLGDIMCKAEMLPAFENAGEGYCFDSLFAQMKPLFKTADYVFANLETPISFDDLDLTGEQFCFNSPCEFAEAVKMAGIDFVATANNHCLDRGVDGITSTIRSLEKIGLAHTGVFSSREKKPLIVDVQGIKIGIMSYTYGTNAFSNHNYLPFREYWRVNLFQNQELSNRFTREIEKRKGGIPWRVYHKLMRMFYPINETRRVYERREFSLRCKYHLRREIRDMKQQSPDFIVMYMHAGGQYNPEATEDTKNLAEYLIRNGVNVVVGTHEHVVHGGDFSQFEIGALATYSLGNFDGIAGVYAEPFDKMAEYSIAWHIYVDRIEKRITKTSFSVLKTVRDGEESMKIKTVPVFDLYQSLDGNEKEKLFQDTVEIARRFAGMDVSALPLQEEYSLQ